MDKTRQMRFTDSELEVIKNTFLDNEGLLKAIRKVFLQIPLSSKEDAMIKKLSKQKEVLKVIRKTFLPTIDGDAPFHQVIDLWATLKLEGKDSDTVLIDALTREKLIQYLDERLLALEGDMQLHQMDFNSLVSLEGKDELDIHIDLGVRNMVIAHVEMQLSQFLLLAGQEGETVEETKERLFRNSAK